MEQVTTLCEVLGEETRVCDLLVDVLPREQRAELDDLGSRRACPTSRMRTSSPSSHG